MIVLGFDLGSKEGDWSAETISYYDDRGMRHVTAAYRWQNELDLVPNKANEKAGIDAGTHSIDLHSYQAKTSA